MTNEPVIPVEIFQNLEQLGKQGKHINRTQRWILITCYDNYHTIRELADKQNVTYQAMHAHVKRLEDLNLIDKAYKQGNEWYYKCRFDISVTADYSYRFTIRKTQLTFEQLLFYLYAQEIENFPKPVMSALIYLYQRSQARSEGKELNGPSAAEVKSFVLSLCDQLQEFTTNVRILTEGKLFEGTPDSHELYGPVEGELFEDLMSRSANALTGWWANKQVGPKGIKLDNPKEVSQEGRRRYDRRWELRIESKENP